MERVGKSRLATILAAAALGASAGAATMLPIKSLGAIPPIIGGPYRSRGKGEGYIGNKRSKRRVAMDKRAALKARNRRRAREAA